MGYRQKSDAALVRAMQQGEEGAFNELYERYHKLVYFIAYQMTKCEADAEEIKQEVFIRVVRYIADIKDVKQFKFWLVTITQNECKRLFRSHKDKGMSDTELDLLNAQRESRRDYLPEQQAHYRSDLDVLKDCILHLNEEQRTVVTLKYFAQLSIEEIADLLQVPNGTVKSRLAYAKKLLRIDVEHYCRQYDITLSFHMDALGTACAMIMAKEGITAVMKPPRFSLSFNGTTLAELALGTAVVVFSGCGVLSYYQARGLHQDINAQEQKPFDAKEAYTILKQWAHCEIELNEKSEAEKAAMRPLYRELKEQGDLYFILLEQYWHDAFE